MNFKDWLKFNEIAPTSIGFYMGLPTDKNAGFGRSDVRSKYISDIGTGKLPPGDNSKKKETPVDDLFGFDLDNKKSLKKINRPIDKRRQGVPLRIPVAYT